MPEEWQFFLENACGFVFPMSISGSADQLFFSRQIGIDPITGLVLLQMSPKSGSDLGPLRRVKEFLKGSRTGCQYR